MLSLGCDPQWPSGSSLADCSQLHTASILFLSAITPHDSHIVLWSSTCWTSSLQILGVWKLYKPCRFLHSGKTKRHHKANIRPVSTATHYLHYMALQLLYSFTNSNFWSCPPSIHWYSLVYVIICNWLTHTNGTHQLRKRKRKNYFKIRELYMEKYRSTYIWS